MTKRGSWRTRFGFYLLAIGSACGLGNLWRFPYVVGENGGGAFVLLYILLAFAIGAPLLIAELVMGKSSRKSVVLVTQNLSAKAGKNFRWVGRFSVLLSLTVLAYYAVISGWVLHFLTQFFVDIFRQGDLIQETSPLNTLMNNGWLQWLLASAHLLIAMVVVVKGVQEGIERWISYMMPLFAALVALLVVRSLSLPSTYEVLRFLFYPDFSKLTYSSLIHATGHMFFTLSLGFGTMVTFGSYIREEDHTPTAGFRVAVVDTIISLVAVLMIFPVAFQASNVPLTDPALLFEVLPRYLGHLRGGQFFGFLFFLCLYMAALNASLGLLEVVVANLTDVYKKISRSKATWYAGLTALALASLPSLSSSVFEGVRWRDHSLIETMDSLLINWALPLVTLGLIMTYVLGTTDKEKEQAFVDRNRFVSATMYPHWLFCIKWLAPGVILLGMFLQILGVILEIHT